MAGLNVERTVSRTNPTTSYPLCKARGFHPSCLAFSSPRTIPLLTQNCSLRLPALVPTFVLIFPDQPLFFGRLSSTSSFSLVRLSSGGASVFLREHLIFILSYLCRSAFSSLSLPFRSRSYSISSNFTTIGVGVTVKRSFFPPFSRSCHLLTILRRESKRFSFVACRRWGE